MIGREGGRGIQQKWRGKIPKEAGVKRRVTQGGSADCQQGLGDIGKRLKISHWIRYSRRIQAFTAGGILLGRLRCVRSLQDNTQVNS